MAALRTLAVTLLGLGLGLAAAAPLAGQEVRMVRFFRDGASASISSVRVARTTPDNETVVFAIQGPGGRRLFLRRQPAEPGTVVQEVWLDTRPGISVTRRGRRPALVEGGGWSLEVYDADLRRRTVRCWLGIVASKVDPRLLTAAADFGVLYEASGLGPLDEAFYPIWLLWHVDEPASLPLGGPLKSETGPFSGAPWNDLARLALEELGRP
jgi:hypothetical protein